MSKVTQSSFYTIGCQKSSSAPAPVVAVKYHPGIYVAQFKGTNLASTALDMPLHEFVDYPCIRGWLNRVMWRDLESTQGNYTAGFAKIDAWLALLPDGKKLQILFEYKTGVSDPATSAELLAPDYITTGTTYDGGTFYYDSTNPNQSAGAGGRELRLWNPNLRARLVALAAAYGAYYNGNPKFEGFCVTEAALQNPITPSDVTADWEQQQWIGLFKFVEALKAGFPNTMVTFFMNYKQIYLNRAINGGTFGSVAEGQYTVAGIKNLGVGLGGPDVCYNDYGLGGYDSSKTPPVMGGTNPGVYSYYADMAGQIPICPSMQRTGFLFSQAGPHTLGGIAFPPVNTIYNYAKNNLFANYLYVTRATATATDPDSWATFLAFLNANPAIRDSVTGGLNTGKPAAYAAVITT